MLELNELISSTILFYEKVDNAKMLSFYNIAPETQNIQDCVMRAINAYINQEKYALSWEELFIEVVAYLELGLKYKKIIDVFLNQKNDITKKELYKLVRSGTQDISTKKELSEKLIWLKYSMHSKAEKIINKSDAINNIYRLCIDHSKQGEYVFNDAVSTYVLMKPTMKLKNISKGIEYNIKIRGRNIE